MENNILDFPEPNLFAEEPSLFDEPDLFADNPNSVVEEPVIDYPTAKEEQKEEPALTGLDKLRSEVDEKSPYLKLIAEHLIETKENDPFFADIFDKTVNSRKLTECFKYIEGKAKEQATNGCAMVEDYVVYGWAEDFYTMADEAYLKDFAPKPKPEPKPDTKKSTKKSTKKTTSKKVTKSAATLEEPDLFADDGVNSLIDDGFVPDDGTGAAIFSMPETKISNEILTGQMDITSFLSI